MYAITKDFAFSAAHHLLGLRDGHPCGRVHGHNYVVRVTLEHAILDATGFVQDYNDLAPIGAFIDTMLDHQDLNGLLPQPTAEHLAKFLYDRFRPRFPYLAAISVSETPKTWATYRP